MRGGEGGSKGGEKKTAGKKNRTNNRTATSKTVYTYRERYNHPRTRVYTFQTTASLLTLDSFAHRIHRYASISVFNRHSPGSKYRPEIFPLPFRYGRNGNGGTTVVGYTLPGPRSFHSVDQFRLAPNIANVSSGAGVGNAIGTACFAAANNFLERNRARGGRERGGKEGGEEKNASMPMHFPARDVNRTWSVGGNRRRIEATGDCKHSLAFGGGIRGEESCVSGNRNFWDAGVRFTHDDRGRYPPLPPLSMRRCFRE